MGLGALEAVEAAGLSEQVKVLSVDAIPEAVASVAAGGLAGTVAQYPDEMAVLAVEAMRKVIAGRPIAPFIESPVRSLNRQCCSSLPRMPRPLAAAFLLMPPCRHCAWAH